MIINHLPSLHSNFQTNWVRWMEIEISAPVSTSWPGLSLLYTPNSIQSAGARFPPLLCTCLCPGHCPSSGPLHRSPGFGHLWLVPYPSPPRVLPSHRVSKYSLHHSLLELSIAQSLLAYHINSFMFLMAFHISVPWHMLLPLALNGHCSSFKIHFKCTFLRQS